MVLIYYIIDMLVWGTANPEGLAESYNGLYLRNSDITHAFSDIIGMPVKIEHRGVDVGRVVSAFPNGGKLDIVICLDKTVVEGAIIFQLVRNGTCKELSLGYSAQVTASANGEDIIGRKKIQEVSLVRKGARDKCLIHGFST